MFLSSEAEAKSPETTKQKNEVEVESYRLPRTVLPVAYDMQFEPNLKNFKFKGSGTIEVEVKEPVQSIQLNALELKVKSATLKSETQKSSLPGRVKELTDKERIEISFDRPLTPGKHTLNLVFTGILNDKLRGFYRSHYKDSKGKKHWLATTQMEPTDARRMFPCFDEPDMKATFKLSVKIDLEHKAISNGKIIKETIDKKTNKKLVEFEATPIMSSYLVALIVGDFESTETKLACGIPIRVWALKGKEKLANYALKETAKVLEYQTKYFGIPYPSNKLDLIAIPDFRSGAMENLGAITFREARLLVDEKKGSNFLKRSVVAVIAHELAHQWFGDLVTMEWWDDIWLNEAFASWMGTKTVEAIHPEWQELARAIYTRNGSMRIDELKATRAIHAEVKNPKEAAEMFDGITYDKGESILWMLEGFVGETPFQKGIQNYLKKNKFGNAKSEDLWVAIGHTSAKPVPEIMKTWILQPGFPILSVNTLNNQKKLSLTQNRFFELPDSKPTKQTWRTPVVLRDLIASKDANNKLALQLIKRSQEFEIPATWSLAFVNADGRGYYRVSYPKNLRTKILENYSSMTTEEKLAYLSDLSALDKKGVIPVEDRLEIMLKVNEEKDPLVKSGLLSFVRQPYSYLDQKEKPSYQKLAQSLAKPIGKSIGWEARKGESYSQKRLRTNVFHLLGTIANDQEVIGKARKLYQSYMKDRSSVSADIAGDILAITAYNGSVKEYNEVFNAYKKELIPEHEKRLLSTLASFRDPELVEKTLKLTLSDDIRAQDGFRLLSRLLYSDDTNMQSWKFIKSNWKKVTAKFPGRSMAYIASACASFDTKDMEAELKSFYEKHELPAAKSAVSRMLEKVHARVIYRQRNAEKIKTWVTQKAKII